MTVKQTILFLASIFCCTGDLSAQWEPVQMPSVAFNSQIFAQDSVLMVCLNQFYPDPKVTLRSADFGESWVALPDSLADWDYTFRAAGGYLYAFSGPQTILSADGGITWSSPDVPYGPMSGNEKTFLHDTIFYCDIYGTILRQHPDGSRDTVYVDPDKRLIQLLNRLDNRLIRATALGISYSDDSGDSWSKATGVPDLTTLSIAYWQLTQLGARAFLLIRAFPNSLLLRSDDLGASWQNDTFFASDGCEKIRLWSTSRAAYFETSCMGQPGFSPSRQWRLGIQDSTWQMYTPPVPELYMVGETDSILVGSYLWEGPPYRSTDQGMHWNAIPPPSGQAFDPLVFYHWPDGHSEVLTSLGWHKKTGDTKFYRYQPDLPNCADQFSQRGDSIFWVCPSPYGICFTPDRGETWDTLIPFNYIGNTKVEKLIWDEDGIFAQIANPSGNIPQLGRWSFAQNDWTDLQDLPGGVVDWEKAGAWFYALADVGGDYKIFVSGDGGGSWQLLDNLPPLVFINRIEHGGNALFAIDAGDILVYRTDNGGQTWDKLPPIYPVPGGWGVSPDNILTAPDGMLFMAVPGKFLFSDDEGFNWVPLNDSIAETNIDGVLQIGPDEQLYLTTRNRTLMRRPTADFRKLATKARVLLDTDGNGVVSAPDLPAVGIPVSSASHTAITDSAGIALVGLRTDLIEDTLHAVVALPNTSVSPAFYPVKDPGKVYTFLLTPDTPRYMELHIHTFNPPRPGFTSTYQLKVANYGAQPESGRLKFVHDQAMQWLDATPAPDASAGDTLYWSIPDLKPWSEFQASVRTALPPATPLGGLTRQFAAMEVDSTGSGWTSAAVDSISEIIVGSFDPNDKQAEPPGNLTVQDVDKGLDITYTIRFQNTGTFLAENVLVVDTLPAELDARTFRFLGSSHPCEVRLKSSNVLEFHFQQIRLPDSTANEPASHGFVRFRIRPFTDLAPGEVIRNMADIYFDFNAPVRTNTAINAILLSSRNLQGQTLIPLQCQPNPAQTDIWINWPEQKEVQAMVYRWDGTYAGTLQLQNYGIHRMDIRHLPAGMYSVKAITENRVYQGRFVKL